MQGRRAAMEDDRAKLMGLAELAAAFRGTSEFALESSQRAAACLAMLRQVWPDRFLDWVAGMLGERQLQPTLAPVLGVGSARHGIAAHLALPEAVRETCGHGWGWRE
jgi:urease accessory protein